ncbi:hypothetical protein AB0L00_01245 [Actinoallomurus sp. NPDC052308]|uniref:hypothetical protein n=1 Tax=Actinoallomurus sp. NPDC052308 TaxID=3155530 RepID=UPI00343C5D2B
MAEGAFEPAPSARWPGARNPVTQFGLWEMLATWCVHAFQVSRPIEELAERLRIKLEQSWDDLDGLSAACIRGAGESFAIVSHRGGRPGETEVWLIKGEHGENAEVVFLDLFGLSEQDVTWRADHLRQ